MARAANPSRHSRAPNFLILMTDDQSWLHTGYAGDPVISTPNIDSIAEQGVIFDHAFCSASSCAPSRASTLTGRNFWELEEGANLFGLVKEQSAVLPYILGRHGYHCGYTGKGYGPSAREQRDLFDPAGPRRILLRETKPYQFNKHHAFDWNYSKSFEVFLKQKPDDKPFYFWCGFIEPHLPYDNGSGKRAGLDPANVILPPYVPDNAVSRRFFLDYSLEIQHVDDHIGRMLSLLKAHGQLDNTLIIFTSDNGMALPRAKGNCYDWGTRVPFAVRWGDRVPPARQVTDHVILPDIAPTLLEAAGVPIPPAMTARSFLPVLLSDKDGRIDPARDHSFFGKERHNADAIHPMRAIRTDDYLYIYNFNPGKPHRFSLSKPPPPISEPHAKFLTRVTPAGYIIRLRNEPGIRPYYDAAYGSRPQEELYDIRQDPYQLTNLAASETHAAVKRRLKMTLFAHLETTADPRASGNGDVFNAYARKHHPRLQERGTNE